MHSMTISIVAIGLYLLSSGLIAFRLFQGADNPNRFKTPIMISGFLAMIIHAGLLYHGLVTSEGINLGIFNAMSLVSCLIVLIVLLTALYKPVENLGLVLFPMAAIAILLENTLPSHRIIETSSPWQLQLHILISILAYSLLTIAMVQAALLAIQDRHLHNRQPGGFIRSLPPLQTMESLLFQMIAIGFTLLTLALITGSLYLDDIFARHLAHKTILSIAAWIIFATLLWGRYHYGWRGRKAIRWTLGGFFLLMLAYFGSKLVLELVLKR